MKSSNALAVLGVRMCTHPAPWRGGILTTIVPGATRGKACENAQRQLPRIDGPARNPPADKANAPFCMAGSPAVKRIGLRQGKDLTKGEKTPPGASWAVF